MRDLIHLLLTVAKWPLALSLLATLPAVLLALGRVLLQMARQPLQWWPLWAGAGLFALAWLLWWRRRTQGSWLYTLEHELTHALFAVLTFNRVTRLTAARGSGELEYLGRGNWLISLAPYFFPSFCVLPLVALHLARPPAQPWLLGLLGYTLAMHLHGTATEIHRHQPDLQRSGLVASACILPGAVGLSLLVVLAAVPGQAGLVFETSRRSLVDAWHWIAAVASPWLA
jgi:Peptidase M50B-like